MPRSRIAADFGWARTSLLVAFATLAACSDPTCQYNADCADGQVCTGGVCETPGQSITCPAGRLSCGADAECPSNKCESGCCTVACASRLDCPEGQECRAGVCREAETPTGCTLDSDCKEAGRSKCRVASHECVRCLAASDCDDTQICSTAHTCELAPGRCSSNGDCARTSATPVCETATKRCVRCLQDVDCGANARCTAEHLCEARPTGCARDSECTTAAAPHCLSSTRACVACTNDLHCSTDGTRRCNDGHECEDAPLPGCGSDADCSTDPVGKRCRIADRACVKCLQSADCASGERCLNDNTCAPSGTCSTSLDCAAPTSVCTSDRRCVECLVGPDCQASGMTCADNLCVATSGGCATDIQCASPRPRCRTSDRTCVACLVRADCGPLQQCSQGACIAAPCANDVECTRVSASAPRCAPSGACVECLQDGQCGAGKICRANVCVLGGCGSDADCASAPATPVCETGARVCVQCVSDGQCGANRKCQQNRCVEAGCTSDAQCTATPSTPKCKVSTGACVACTADSQCAIGLACTADACAPVPDLDKACTTNADCPASLYCVGNTSGSFCRAPCAVYAQDSRCPADRRCAFVGYDASGSPEGACVPARAGTSGVGGVCSSTQRCDADLTCVYDSPSAGKCRRWCDPATGAACAQPNKCQKLYADDDGIPRSIGACFPDTKYLDPCPTPTTCDGGLVCAAMPDGNNPTTLRNLCDWPVGAKDGLAGCNVDSDCRSGFCLEPSPLGYKDATGADMAGYCQQGCSADTQCAAGNGRPGACAGFPFLWSDATGAPSTQGVPSCVVQCKSEFDCRADDTCALVANVTGTAWVTRCRPASSTGLRFGGASCSTDSQCWSGTCYHLGSATDGICAGVCDPTHTGADSDCDWPGECPANGVLQTVGAGPDGVRGTNDDAVARAPICWGSACTRDGDCAGESADSSKPRACSADPDPRNPADIVLSCAPRIGAKKGGEVCTVDTDCQTGWCVAWTNAAGTKSTKRCFGACQGSPSSLDCTGTTANPTTCADYQWTSSTPNKTQRLCLPVFQ